MSRLKDPAAVLRIGREAGDLARLYPWLDAAVAPWNLPEKLAHPMHVALEEAVVNVAMHAYADGEPGEIVIALRLEHHPIALLPRSGKALAPAAVTLVIEDAGAPFDPVSSPERPRATRLEDAVPGGLGLGLLRHFCRDISYARIDGRNRLTLRFALASGN